MEHVKTMDTIAREKLIVVYGNEIGNFKKAKRKKELWDNRVYGNRTR